MLLGFIFILFSYFVFVFVSVFLQVKSRNIDRQVTLLFTVKNKFFFYKELEETAALFYSFMCYVAT
jgi:hypothetical protein